MRITAYESDRGTALGIVLDDETILPVATIAPDLPTDLTALLAIEGALERLAVASNGQRGGSALAELRLVPFLSRANALWALALNFKTHIRETGLTTSHDHPHLFLRTASSYVGAGQPIVAPHPDVAKAFDYEGELAAIIGRPGRHIPPERALSHVAGYTCLNEGSVREYQHHNRQFGLGKNFERSGSYGPWMVTADVFGDPATHRVITRVNGVTRQDAPLNDMLFDVAATVSYLSQGYTLQPGDLIAMGTPGALPPQPGDVEGRDLDRQFGTFKTPGLVHMRPGDEVEVEIDGIGILSNPIVEDAGLAYRVS
jgi:2-keto-4-pentenoate hydratase/2-oxohepta-3-ene-1,7-dioic acid hydratase in catechol pathway